MTTHTCPECGAINSFPAMWQGAVYCLFCREAEEEGK